MNIADIGVSLVIEAMDWDIYTRYTTSLQNRMLKSMHGLAIVDQYEAKTVQISGVAVGDDQANGARMELEILNEPK